MTTEQFQFGTWYPIESAPEGEPVNTRINDADGIRNEQVMRRSGKLWWIGDMYVYYSPTEWSPLPSTSFSSDADEMERHQLMTEMLALAEELDSAPKTYLYTKEATDRTLALLARSEKFVKPANWMPLPPSPREKTNESEI